MMMILEEEMWDQMMKMDIERKGMGEAIVVRQQFLKKFLICKAILILGEMHFINLVV